MLARKRKTNRNEPRNCAKPKGRSNNITKHWDQGEQSASPCQQTKTDRDLSKTVSNPSGNAGAADPNATGDFVSAAQIKPNPQVSVAQADMAARKQGLQDRLTCWLSCSISSCLG